MIRRPLRFLPSLIFSFCLVLAAGPAFSTEGPLVISEIMFNPNGDENAREFVEIQNISAGPVSLENCRVGDGTAFDDLTAVGGNDWTVPAGGYAVILDPDYFAADEPYGNLSGSALLLTVKDTTIGSRGLSNSTPEPVYLISAGGDTLSVVRYSIDCSAGHSWEKVNPDGSDLAENFLQSKEVDGTPGYRNSVTPSDHNPALGSESLRFIPDPPRMGAGLDIFVSYRNGGLTTLNGARVTVTMLPDTPLAVIDFSGELAPGEYSPEQSLHIDAVPGGLLGFEAYIEGGEAQSAVDDTLRTELDVPVPAGTVLLNEIMAAPKDGPEWMEILNSSSSPVSLRGWKVSDSRGVPSDSVSARSLVSPGGYALITGDSTLADCLPGIAVFPVAKFPSLNNDGDSAVLLDRSGALRDSVDWNSSDSGISLERISPLLSGTTAWDNSVAFSGSTPGARNSIFFNRVEDDGGISGGPSALTITPNPFSGTATIAYDLPFPLARVRLDVYDRRGRRVATLRDVSESGSSWTGTWDGASGGRKLPAGPYILFFEALNKNTGNMVSIRKTVVVGTRL